MNFHPYWKSLHRCYLLDNINSFNFRVISLFGLSSSLQAFPFRALIKVHEFIEWDQFIQEISYLDLSVFDLAGYLISLELFEGSLVYVHGIFCYLCLQYSHRHYHNYCCFYHSNGLDSVLIFITIILGLTF